MKVALIQPIAAVNVFGKKRDQGSGILVQNHVAVIVKRSVVAGIENILHLVILVRNRDDLSIVERTVATRGSLGPLSGHWS